jgi:hypothetical protein
MFVGGEQHDRELLWQAWARAKLDEIGVLLSTMIVLLYLGMQATPADVVAVLEGLRVRRCAIDPLLPAIQG